MNLLELRQDTLSLLSQAANSRAGQLDSGTSPTPTITTANTLTQYLNEACAELARQVWPWEDVGTVTTPIGAVGVLFDSLVTDGGGVIFSASSEGVTWNGTVLRRISQDMAGIWYRTIESDANATPVNWSEWELCGVRLLPRPATLHDTTVRGPATPPLLVADGDTPDFLPASLHKYLPYYAAGKLAEKNTQNADIAARIPVWSTEWNDGKQAIYQRALKTRPSLLARLEMVMVVGGGK